MSMTGRSKTPPKGDVKPLGTKTEKKTVRRRVKLSDVKTDVASPETKQETATIFIWPSSEKEVAIDTASEVNSVEQMTDVPSQETAETKDKKNMEAVTLTRKPATAKSLTVQYGIDGRRGSVRFSKSLFEAAPETLTINVEGLAAPKVKETREERRARLKAMPKKTAAEKLAALEQRAARLRDKLAAEQQPAAV
jgi:hypothetical protein